MKERISKIILNLLALGVFIIFAIGILSWFWWLINKLT